MSSYVYRYFDIHGELLYIGLADNPESRLAQHQAEKAWADQIARWETVEYPTRGEAAAAERAAIVGEQPKYNVVHGPAPQLERKPGIDRYVAVRVSPELAERLERRARRHGTTVTSVIRRALVQAFMPEAFDPPARAVEPKPAPKFRPRAQPSPRAQAEAAAIVRRAFGCTTPGASESVPEPKPTLIDF